MAEAVPGKGAVAYLGDTKTVGTAFAYDVAKTLFQCMVTPGADGSPRRVRDCFQDGQIEQLSFNRGPGAEFKPEGSREVRLSTCCAPELANLMPRSAADCPAGTRFVPAETTCATAWDSCSSEEQCDSGAGPTIRCDEAYPCDPHEVCSDAHPARCECPSDD